MQKPPLCVSARVNDILVATREEHTPPPHTAWQSSLSVCGKEAEEHEGILPAFSQAGNRNNNVLDHTNDCLKTYVIFLT